MNWIKNLKISQKVLSFVIISALFTAIAGYTGYHYNNQTAQSSSVLYNDNLLPIKWMNENRSQFRANEANLLWIILTNNKQEQQKHFRITSYNVCYTKLLRTLVPRSLI